MLGPGRPGGTLVASAPSGRDAQAVAWTSRIVYHPAAMDLKPGSRHLVLLAVVGGSVLAAHAAFAQQASAARTDPPPATTRPQSQPAAGAAEGAETPAPDKPPPRVLDLSSPRATMREFLLAVQDARGEHPERIRDAVQCLDTSELEGEPAERLERAQPLAQRLFDVIDRAKVTLDDIPEEPAGVSFLFYPREPDGGPEIRIAADFETDRWRFTARTLESVPALEKAILEASEPQKPAASDVLSARRNARATMATFLEAMNAKPPDLARAVQCLDATGRDAEAWKVQSGLLAEKLKFTMDRIKVAVLPEIPEDPVGPPYTWYTSETGNIVLHRIEDGAFKGEWRFTPSTLKTLDALYEELEDQQVVDELRAAGVEQQLSFRLRLQRSMPEPLRQVYLGLKGWQWLALIGLLLGGWVIKWVATAVGTAIVSLWFRRHNIDVDRARRRQALRSLGAVLMVLLWYLAIRELDLPEGWLKVLLPTLWFVLAVATAWLAYRVVDASTGYVLANRDVQLTDIDDLLLPMVRRIVRVVAVVVLLLIVLDWMGWSPKTVLGALGIGGIAIAFAAKDTLGNFFGSLAVLFDRPFSIGDWIAMGNVDGTVEHVGFRSTRVRTFYNSVVTIPNSEVSNSIVDNYGKRRFRRIKVMLSVTYATPPDRIDAFCEGIRELIRLHPYTRKDYYHVYFNQFADSSLDILLYCFVETPDWATELRERHRLFVDILRLADSLGVEFAFPTRTLWLERPPAGGPAEAAGVAEGAEAPEGWGLKQAARVFEDAYGPKPAHRGPVVIDTRPRSREKDGRTSAP